MTFDDKCHLHGLILVFQIIHHPFPLLSLHSPSASAFFSVLLNPLLITSEEEHILLCFPLFLLNHTKHKHKHCCKNGGGRVINFLYQNHNPFSVFTALTLICFFTFLWSFSSFVSTRAQNPDFYYIMLCCIKVSFLCQDKNLNFFF